MFVVDMANTFSHQDQLQQNNTRREKQRCGKIGVGIRNFRGGREVKTWKYAKIVHREKAQMILSKESVFFVYV